MELKAEARRPRQPSAQHNNRTTCRSTTRHNKRPGGVPMVTRLPSTTAPPTDAVIPRRAVRPGRLAARQPSSGLYAVISVKPCLFKDVKLCILPSHPTPAGESTHARTHCPRQSSLNDKLSVDGRSFDVVVCEKRFAQKGSSLKTKKKRRRL